MADSITPCGWEHWFPSHAIQNLDFKQNRLRLNRQNKNVKRNVNTVDMIGSRKMDGVFYYEKR